MPVDSAHRVNRKAIGLLIEDLETPALLLDGVSADRNIHRMADFFRGRPCRLRPQFNSHRCLELARHQAGKGGTAGIACATVGEAEALAAYGFADIVIGHQIIGQRKVERLIELARRVNIRVAVGDPLQAVAISELASMAKATVGVLIELDVSAFGAGAAPGKAAMEMAHSIDGLPRLRLDGFHVQDGPAVYIGDFERRAETVRQTLHYALEIRRRIEDDGIPIRILSGGSSATYQIVGVVQRSGRSPSRYLCHHGLALRRIVPRI